MTAPVIVVEDYAALFRLFEAICHPETVEGYEPESPLETQKRRVRIVYASPLLVHHSALVDMKRKQDSE
jgi:hypothetical protein